jgi:hypothetical protein
MIASLCFNEINERYENISLSHHSSLEWIFLDQKLGFESWLRRGTGIFWIKGKPGSGKSTLMRFLRDDRRTTDALIVPKTDQKWTVVWFFFHERGSYMQNSYEALLRSILFQIVSQDTGSAEVLLPFYLSQGSNIPTRGNWSVTNMDAALAAILSTSVKVMFWLDALDEFAGPPRFIADFLEKLVKQSSESGSCIRICFSSREWDEFERAFGKYPNFQIHEQTRDAIISYASWRLKDAKLDNQVSTWNADKRIKISPAVSPSLEIASTIANLAKGVFLWVKIVIDNFLELSRTPTLEELEKLLSGTPENLEDLYKRAINRLPNDHRVEAFVMLELISRVGPLDLELVVLAPDFAFCETAAECADAIRRTRSKEWFAQDAELKRQLKNRCGGLLEIVANKEPSSNSPKCNTFLCDVPFGDHLVHPRCSECGRPPSSNKVQFMHQTVKDFVEDLAFEKHVFGLYHSPFYQNGHSFWMKYYFAVLLMLDGRRPICGNLRPLQIEELIHYVRLAESTTGRSQGIFLDSVPDHALNWKVFELLPERGPCPINTVMALAVAADLRLYVRQKLVEKGSQIVNENPVVSLLHCAVWSARSILHDPDSIDYSATSSFNLCDMVRLLLEHGADINAKFHGMTPFQYLFYQDALSGRGWAYHEFSYAFSSDMVDIARTILEHGQNPDIPIIGARNETFYPLHVAQGAMTKLLLAYNANVNCLDSYGRTPLVAYTHRVSREMELARKRETISILEACVSSI